MNLDQIGVEKIVDYFDACHPDYLWIWNTRKNLSMHHGFYDSHHKTHDEAVINMNRILADKARISAKDVVLDIGCGVGGSAFWIAENIGSRVVGVNISKVQHEFARHQSRRKNLNDRIEFYLRDFHDTRFPDESFDVVWAAESICHSGNKKKVLAEIQRVLKKGGRLIVEDGFSKKELMTEKEIKIMRRWTKGWVVPQLAGISEFKNYLRELDFNSIEFTDITDYAIFSSKRAYLLGILLFPFFPFRTFHNGFSSRSKMVYFNMLSAIYQYKALRKELWGYGIFYAEKN